MNSKRERSEEGCHSFFLFGRSPFGLWVIISLSLDCWHVILILPIPSVYSNPCIQVSIRKKENLAPFWASSAFNPKLISIFLEL